MTTLTTNPARRSHLIDFLWLLLLVVYVFAGRTLVPFHGDESTLTYMSRDYAYQFIDRNFDLVRYQPDPPHPELQYLSMVNGSIGKYIIGLGWHVAGYTIADTNEQWDWAAHWSYNQTTGHAPSDDVLMAVRVPSTLLTAASVIVLFVIGRFVGGRPVAYLASLYYALHPVILMNGRRAMMEGPHLLGALLLVLAGLYFMRRASWRSALVLGAAAGFAMSAKHTNLFVLVTVFGACVLYPFLHQLARAPGRATSPLRAGLLIIPALLVFAFVFWLLNPVWWGSEPLSNLLHVLRYRTDMLALQSTSEAGYEGRLDQLAGFLRYAFVALPMYYEVPQFAEPLADQIARYQASPWQGVSIGGSVPGGIALFALVVVGAWSFVRNRAVHVSTRWLISLWALAMFLTTWLLTPLEWQRYYMPAYPVVGLLGAVGVVAIARRVLRRQRV